MKGLGIVGLGLVASGRRNIRSGIEFDNLYSRKGLVGTDPIIGGEWSTTYDTLDRMAEIVGDTLSDTGKVAKKLKGSSLEETVRNIWEHVYKHFQYKKDAPKIEQIRRPSRSWLDRQIGIDCDCMSVVIGSLLHNLSINFAFRKAAYNPSTGWQHVYIVVPKRKGLSLNKRDNYYVLDCVVDRFDYEVPFLETFDKVMKIQYLNGIPLHGGVTLSLGLFGGEFNGLDGLDATPQDFAALFLSMLKQHLINTRKLIAFNPAITTGIYDPATFTQRLDYLISSFDDPNQRDKALGELSDLEDRETINGLSGGLGFFKKIAKGIKKVAKKVGSAVKTVATKVASSAKTVVKKVGEGVKVAAKAVGKAVKAVAKVIVRFNPLTIAVRNGLLLAMKLNLFRMAEKLGYGYWTEQQAQEKGLDIDEFRKSQKTLEKVRKIHKGLGGKVEKFDKAVKKGWERGVKKHNLVHGLNFVSGLDGKKKAKKNQIIKKKLSLSKSQLVRASQGKTQKATAARPTIAQQKAKAIIKNRVSAAMPLLKMVDAQLRPVQYKSLLRKTDSQELDQFYQAVRTNKNGMATKLGLAFKPVAEADKYDKSEYSKLLARMKVIEGMVAKRGGSVQELRDAIEAGKQVAIVNQGIGEVAAASTAAASSVLAVIGKLLKAVNFVKMFKGRASSPDADETEIQKTAVSAELEEDIDDEGDPNAQVIPFQNLVDSVTDTVTSNPIVQRVTNSPVVQAIKNQVLPSSSTSTQEPQAAEPGYTEGQYATAPYATPGIVNNSSPGYSQPGYQEAQVISSNMTPPKKDNTVKYIAIAGGVGIGLWILSRALQRPQPNVVAQTIPGAPVPVIAPMSGPKKKTSSRTRRKVMTITV